MQSSIPSQSFFEYPGTKRFLLKEIRRTRRILGQGARSYDKDGNPVWELFNRHHETHMEFLYFRWSSSKKGNAQLPPFESIDEFLLANAKKQTLVVACAYWLKFRAQHRKVLLSDGGDPAALLEAIRLFQVCGTLADRYRSLNLYDQSRAIKGAEGRKKQIAPKEKIAIEQMKKALSDDPNLSPSDLAESLLGAANIKFRYDKLLQLARKVKTESLEQ